MLATSKGEPVTDAPRRPPTWLEVAVSNAGMIKAATAISWAWCWGITREIVGHDPSVEEVAEQWGASARTAYRDHANFRKAFPFLEDPTPYVEQAEVKPLVVAAARKMKEVEDRLRSRGERKKEKRPIDLAARGIGFAPCLALPTT